MDVKKEIKQVLWTKIRVKTEQCPTEIAQAEKVYINLLCQIQFYPTFRFIYPYFHSVFKVLRA